MDYGQLCWQAWKLAGIQKLRLQISFNAGMIG
jgi:hypothetical protein